MAVLKNAPAAAMATLLYCFNPASIFYSAAYTEALFACTTFMGMYQVQTGRQWKGALCLSLAAATRANGKRRIAAGDGLVPYD